MAGWRCLSVSMHQCWPTKPQVDQVLRQLFALHQQSTASKGAVQFFHISKSGGTNMCQVGVGTHGQFEAVTFWAM